MNILSKEGGSVGHWCFPIRIQRNGAFFSLSEMLENGTEDWIERIGWDRDGLLYKIYDNMSSVYSAEKKTRSDQSDSQDRAAYQKLIDNLNESIAQTNRIIYAYDNINIPQTISYFATLALISSQDHGHKNFYLYQDCNNTEEWSLLPWDIDLSWGRNWLQRIQPALQSIFQHSGVQAHVSDPTQNLIRPFSPKLKYAGSSKPGSRIYPCLFGADGSLFG